MPMPLLITDRNEQEEGVIDCRRFTMVVDYEILGPKDYHLIGADGIISFLNHLVQSGKAGDILSLTYNPRPYEPEPTPVPSREHTFEDSIAEAKAVSESLVRDENGKVLFPSDPEYPAAQAKMWGADE